MIFIKIGRTSTLGGRPIAFYSDCSPLPNIVLAFDLNIISFPILSAFDLYVISFIILSAFDLYVSSFIILPASIPKKFCEKIQRQTTLFACLSLHPQCTNLELFISS